MPASGLWGSHERHRPKIPARLVVARVLRDLHRRGLGFRRHEGEFLRCAPNL